MKKRNIILCLVVLIIVAIANSVYAARVEICQAEATETVKTVQTAKADWWEDRNGNLHISQRGLAVLLNQDKPYVYVKADEDDYVPYAPLDIKKHKSQKDYANQHLAILKTTQDNVPNIVLTNNKEAFEVLVEWFDYLENSFEEYNDRRWCYGIAFTEKLPNGKVLYGMWFAKFTRDSMMHTILDFNGYYIGVKELIGTYLGYYGYKDIQMYHENRPWRNPRIDEKYGDYYHTNIWWYGVRLP